MSMFSMLHVIFLINLDLTLIQLLRALEFAPDRQAAQCIARIATSIFNQWNALPHIDPEDDDFHDFDKPMKGSFNSSYRILFQS